MRRHSPLQVTYSLYIVIHLVYLILIGMLLSSLSPGIQFDNLLAISLFISAILAAITALAIMNWKKIWKYIASKLRSL
jgi:hypothetical protein